MEKITYFIMLVAWTNAVPLTVENGETTCLVKNITYTKDEVIPDVEPCSECKCQPPSTSCAKIPCTPNSGCKIISQPNMCCPIYKCDCELNGKSYNNGEKIDDSLNPCHVCYCRGGEIMCTQITCYVRDDCEPSYTQGRCCPKYDHCPPISDDSPARSINSSLLSTARDMQPWLMTKPMTQSTPKYPQTIHIVEILPSPGPVERQSDGPRIVTMPEEKPQSTTEMEITTLNTTDDNSTDYEILSGGTYDEDNTTETEVTASSFNIPTVLKLDNNESTVSDNDPILYVYSPTHPEISEMTVVKGSESDILTPADLRTLAEYIIHEKIKPFSTTLETEPTELSSVGSSRNIENTSESITQDILDEKDQLLVENFFKRNVGVD